MSKQSCIFGYGRSAYVEQQSLPPPDLATVGCGMASITLSRSRRSFSFWMRSPRRISWWVMYWKISSIPGVTTEHREEMNVSAGRPGHQHGPTLMTLEIRLTSVLER